MTLLERRRAQHVFKNGEWHDVVRMGILKSEREEQRAKWSWTPVEIEAPSRPRSKD